MPDELINAIIGAVAGAFSGGIVNLILEKRKEHREDKKERKKEQKEVFENRPELDIIECRNYITRPGYGIKKEYDINIFIAQIQSSTIENDNVYINYNKAHFNKEEWCCVIYTFRNNGKTDIQCINPICNLKKSAILCQESEAKEFLKYRLINYSTWYEKKLRVGETFTMKICFHKDCVLVSTFSAAMSMGLEDDNGRYWIQQFFIPDEKIYNSLEVSHKEYKHHLLADDAIKCFKNPALW